MKKLFLAVVLTVFAMPVFAYTYNTHNDWQSNMNSTNQWLQQNNYQNQYRQQQNQQDEFRRRQEDFEYTRQQQQSDSRYYNNFMNKKMF